jgi:hypothetical protein
MKGGAAAPAGPVGPVAGWSAGGTGAPPPFAVPGVTGSEPAQHGERSAEVSALPKSPSIGAITLFTEDLKRSK